ncbi:kinetochore-associated protein DSN1 homolog isoform X3 [Lethenteron reissneri]|nr:kinetochore-associated protein DSN1 homolog isoform X3 [Lethenteron reissneri]
MDNSLEKIEVALDAEVAEEDGKCTLPNDTKQRRRSSFVRGRVRRSLAPLHSDTSGTGSRRRRWPVKNHSSLQWQQKRRSYIQQRKESGGEREDKLYKTISMDLPVEERLCHLLQALSRTYLQKLKLSEAGAEGFDFAAFEDKAMQCVSEAIGALKKDGTLQRCTEQPKSVPLTPKSEKKMSVVLGDITRLTSEDAAWEQLVAEYQGRAEETSRKEEQLRTSQGKETLLCMPPLSEEVAALLGPEKPDYSALLADLPRTTDTVEIVLDHLQEAARLLTSTVTETERVIEKEETVMRNTLFGEVEASWDFLTGAVDPENPSPVITLFTK